MLEVVFGLHGGCSNIKHLLEHLLALWGDGTIVDEGLEGLLVFTLEHHFKLFLASLEVISFYGTDVEGL